MYKKTIKSTDNLLSHHFSRETILKGQTYYKNNHVLTALRLNDTLYGKILGQRIYVAKVNLATLENTCSCPMQTYCKHVVALLEAKDAIHTLDGDALITSLNTLNKEEVINLVLKLLVEEPAIANILLENIPRDKVMTRSNNTDEQTQNIVKEVKKMFAAIKTYSLELDTWVTQFSIFIRNNRAYFTKEMLYMVLKLLIEAEENDAILYDPYTDEYYGQPIYEALADIWVRTDLTESDIIFLWNALKTSEGTGIGDFLNRIITPENAPYLRNFDTKMAEILTTKNYIQYLINSKHYDRAKELVFSNTVTLPPEVQFTLLLQINESVALAYARDKAFDRQILEYYYQHNNYTEMLTIFQELTTNPARSAKLINAPHVQEILFKAMTLFPHLTPAQRHTYFTELLKIVQKGTYRTLHAQLAIRIAEKNILWDTLPFLQDLLEEYFDLAFQILTLLEDSDHERVVQEFKQLFEWILISSTSHQKEALQVLLKLQTLLDTEDWNNFLKKMYQKHSRKRLWTYLHEKGITLKKVKGNITLEVHL